MFIFELTNKNNHAFNYIMNWLASYFQTLQKSKCALVLIGDKDCDIKTANKKGIKSYKVNNTEKDLYSVTKKFLKII